MCSHKLRVIFYIQIHCLYIKRILTQRYGVVVRSPADLFKEKITKEHWSPLEHLAFAVLKVLCLGSFVAIHAFRNGKLSLHSVISMGHPIKAALYSDLREEDVAASHINNFKMK